jgi:hypothetical protein
VEVFNTAKELKFILLKLQDICDELRKHTIYDALLEDTLLKLGELCFRN